MGVETRENVRALREGLGLTQGAFAKALGVSRRAVVNWEGGKSEPLPVVVKAMEELRRNG